jgi:predicted nicotinamide N-methyase
LGAGLGLCGILAHKLDIASHVCMTDGDVETLENLRRNVARNHCHGDSDSSSSSPNKQHTTTIPTISCPQLIWGQTEQYPPTHSIDILLAADIIYVTEILVPLWETVDAILALDGKFVLAYARRNVPMELVLEHATLHGFVWTCPVEAEGVFVFSRSDKEKR